MALIFSLFFGTWILCSLLLPGGRDAPDARQPEQLDAGLEDLVQACARRFQRSPIWETKNSRTLPSRIVKSLSEGRQWSLCLRLWRSQIVRMTYKRLSPQFEDGGYVFKEESRDPCKIKLLSRAHLHILFTHAFTKMYWVWKVRTYNIGSYLSIETNLMTSKMQCTAGDVGTCVYCEEQNRSFFMFGFIKMNPKKDIESKEKRQSN